MSVSRKPGFFVVGAPKSGTTSLYHYLKKHPQVFLPRRKELLYFCDDLHFSFPILNEAQFMEYYRDWRDEKTAGEVAVWNLYSTTAAGNIRQFNPGARIVIMLRNPVDMMYALHSNHVYNGNETLPDFREALNAQEERRRGDRISATLRSPLEALWYYDVAAYAQQVQRYFDIFGRENVHIILFDDFITRTAEEYSRLLRFIGVNDAVKPEFSIHNPNQVARSNLMKRFTIDAPGWMKKIGQVLFPHQTRRRDWLMQMLWKVNSRKQERSPIDPLLKTEILKKMEPGIRQLELLIHRDLSAWLH